MESLRCRTIKKEVELTGVGLHSGHEVSLKFKPAPVGTGIVFIRSDLTKRTEIPAHFSNIVDTRLATTLAHFGVSISTVEHVLAAVYGSMIDNLYIEVSGPEVPILDGSSHSFFLILQDAGIEFQNEFKSILKIKKSFSLKNDDGKWAEVTPAKDFEIQASFEWSHPILQDSKEFTYVHEDGAFADIASARTFCFAKDIEFMKKLGLIRGGSLENAVVMTDESILNDSGLRYKDECARHKVLDTLGDLALIGLNIQGSFQIHKSGHQFHHQILKKLFEDPSQFEILSGSQASKKALELDLALKNMQRIAFG